MIQNIEDLTEKIREFTMKSVSESRYEHSVRTAETCRKLCRRYGLDERLGYLAGISHDMCKAVSPDLLLSIASRDGAEITPVEMERPGLLHGRAAAVKLQEDFGVTEPDLIEAVACHTFGKAGLCDLSKILYVADKIEPGREHITKEYLESIKKLSLNELVVKVLEENIGYLIKHRKAVAPESEACLAYLKEECL